MAIKMPELAITRLVSIDLRIDKNTMDKVFSEDDIVRNAVKGDVDAFSTLYEKYLDPIFRYIYFRVNNLQDAEDITGMVFIKAWEALPRYRLNGFPFSSWLYRIAHNMVVDFHRKRKSLPIEKVDELGVDHRTNLLAEIAEKEQLRNLINAISRLPDDQQQVIILRFVEGLSHKEIAKIMGKNDGACRMIQHRALETLAKVIVE
jgi:RNA polymerase sigma-70 factor (ECF subfamily)